MVAAWKCARTTAPASATYVAGQRNVALNTNKLTMLLIGESVQFRNSCNAFASKRRCAGGTL